MNLPAILFSLVIAFLAATLFHILRGGNGWRLLINMGFSALGFWLGQWIGVWFIGWLISGWRDEVWQRAVAMMACADAAAQESLRLELERASLVRGRRILLNFAAS